MDSDKNSVQRFQDIVRRHWSAAAIDCTDLRRLAEELDRAEETYVFLRVNLPGVNPCALTGAVRAASDTALVIWMGENDMASAIEGINAGADSYLILPCTEQELDRVAECIQCRKALKQVDERAQ